MSCNFVRLLTAAVAVVSLASAAHAAPPFSQDFSGGVSGWRFTTANAVPLVAQASGGPDGGAFIRNNLATLAGTVQSPNSLILFRAQATYAGIDLGYTGDWIAAGVKQVSAYVRHDAPQPLEFVARFSPATSFPGAFYATSPLVPSGVWTQVFFNVTPGSPQNQTYEGGTYQDVFQGFDNSGVGNMQFGVSIPPALHGTGPYVFDLDKVSVSLTPEPAAGCLAAAGAAVLGMIARRRA